MRMELDMIQTQTVTQRLELEDGEKEKVANALLYWETKPHSEIKFPLKVMYDALGIKDPQSGMLTAGFAAGEKDQQEKANEFAAEFVVLTAEEIASLDPDEKHGVLMGDCIFISDQVPEDYIPMVVANLGFLKRMDDNQALKEIVKDSSLDIDTSRHWTANILDIVLASRQFAENPQEKEKYLAWRKKIERSDFFNNEIISQVLREKTRYREFKRTTHPVQRSLWAKKSWIFSGILYSFGSRMVDENARMLGISKSDIIIRRVCDKYDEQFDPETMCRMIDFISAHPERKQQGYRTIRFVDFGQAGEMAGMMADQAGLLTPEIMGDAAVLEATSDPKVYILRPFFRKSLEAFQDRIAYFTRAGLLRSGMDKQMLAFLKSTARLLGAPAGDEKVKLQLGSGEEPAKIAVRKAEIERKLQEIDQAYERFIKLRIKFTDMQAVDYLPGKLEQNYFKLLAMREKLEDELKEMQEAESSIGEVNQLLAEQKALLAAMVA